MSTRRLTISLDGNLAQAVTRLAQREARAVSNLVARLLTEALHARARGARPRDWPEAAGTCPICGRPAAETAPADCPHHLV